MSKVSQYILLLCLSLALLGCKKENMGDCFKSTGKTERKTRVVAPFSHLVLEDRINVYIQQGPEYRVEVVAGKNLHEHIETSIENNTLLVQNNNTCNWVRSLKKDIDVYLSMPTIESITFRGGGKISFQNQFTQNTFFLDMWDASGTVDLNLNCNSVLLRNHEGTADIYCRGTTQTLESYSNGQGTIDTRSLICKKARAINGNSSLILLSVSDELNAEIRGRGDINYFGTPAVSLQKSGSGNLIAN